LTTFVNEYLWIGKTRYVKKHGRWYDDLTEKEIIQPHQIEHLEYLYLKAYKST
jgi:hypothetical protein